MFRKPKRNFRGRRKDSETDEDTNLRAKDEVCEDDNSLEKSPSPTNAGNSFASASNSSKSKKTKKKKNDADGSTIHKSSSTLSFREEIEDDGESFQIKKSSHSRRVAKQLKKESRREREERERAEQEQNKRGDLNSQISAPGEYSSENMKKMFEEQERANGHAADIMVGSDADISDFDDEEDDDDTKSEGQPSFKDILKSGQIPDANMIHLARKRRQLAREQGGDDFIPLDDTVKVDKNKSRLIREDDNDKSDIEDERIDFTVDQKEKERRHIQTTILAAEEESHSEGSEHEERWIQEQIRKGVQAGGQMTVGPPDNKPSGNNYPQFLFGQTPAYGSGLNENKPRERAPPPRDLKDVSIDSIRKRLQDRLSELCSVHRVHKHEMEDMDSRLEACQLNAEKFQEKIRSLEERYRFFQEMRGYVRDLVECLNEKMSSIVFLERSMNTLVEKRAEKFVRRRQDDVQDQSVLCNAAKHNVPDPSGPMNDPAIQRRAAEREGRRNRRRRARESQNITDHNDGLSTDDEESKSESTKFNSEKERISADLSSLFDDVVDEFHEVSRIKARFESWRAKQRDSYEEAYIGLCLPKLFTPLVRLKLISWNPLEPDAEDFEEMIWFEALMFYGFDDKSNEISLTVDNKLMPSLVEKTVVPRIIGLVESVWDPLSSQQTKRLVSVVKKLVHDYPTISSDNKTTQAMLSAIAKRMKKSLDEDVFVPLYTKQMLEVRSSPHAVFFHRQFWSGIKLLNSFVAWEDILSTTALQELALDGLLNRYLVLAIYNSPVDNELFIKCQAISKALPQSWFANLTGDSTLPQLQNFVRVLTSIASALNQVLISGNDSLRKGAREGVKQITRILVNIHATEQAASLAV